MMKVSRSLAIFGLLVVPFCSHAAPSMGLANGTGSNLSRRVRVVGQLGGARDILGAVVYLQFDTSKVNVPNEEVSFMAGAGWTTGAFNVVGNQAIWVGYSTGGTTDGANIVTVRMTFLSQSSSKVTLLKASNLADQNFDPYDLAEDTELTITPGTLPDPIRLPLGASTHAGPSVLDGVAYAGDDAGKLHAYGLTDRQAVSGFPADISTALGESVKVASRPAAYYGKSGKAVYLTTDRGDVVQVLPDGRIGWATRPVPGHSSSTPAVTPDGFVYVNLGWENAPPEALNFLFRLDELDGRALALSPYLGTSTADSPTDRSPAVDGRYAFINASGEVRGGLVVLNQDNLMPRAGLAPGADSLPPTMVGGTLYLATRSGKVLAANGVTFTPVDAFGTRGQVDLKEPLTTPPFAGPDGTVYVGSSKGHVFALNPTTGAKSTICDIGPDKAITTLIVTGETLAFGTDSGRFYALAPDYPSEMVSAPLSGAVNPGMVFDVASSQFALTTTPGDLYFVQLP